MFPSTSDGTSVRDVVLIEPWRYRLPRREPVNCDGASIGVNGISPCCDAATAFTGEPIAPASGVPTYKNGSAGSRTTPNTCVMLPTVDDARGLTVRYRYGIAAFTGAPVLWTAGSVPSPTLILVPCSMAVWA